MTYDFTFHLFVPFSPNFNIPWDFSYYRTFKLAIFTFESLSKIPASLLSKLQFLTSLSLLHSTA